MVLPPDQLLHLGPDPVGASWNHFDLGLGLSSHINYPQSQLKNSPPQGQPWWYSRTNPTSGKDVVVFSAPLGGATTSTNTQYSRCELREYERDGTTKMAYDPKDGDHWIEGIYRIYGLAGLDKPEITVSQAHSGSDDTIMVSTYQGGLRLRYDGSQVAVLDSTLADGDEFYLKIRVNNGTPSVYYSSNPAVIPTTPTHTSSGFFSGASSGWYFKTGAYNQTNENTDPDVDPDASILKVEVRELKHWHSKTPKGGAWPTPASYAQSAGTPTVSAGADSSFALGGQFSRTATVTLNGATLTSQAWSILSGPTGVGTTLSSSASVTWTPTTVGIYSIGFSADTSAGVFTDTVTVTVTSVSTPVDTNTAAGRFGWGTPIAIDEMSNTGAPLATNWSVYDGPGHAGRGIRNPARVAVNGSIMTLTGTAGSADTAGLAHKYEQKYGKWEIRARSQGTGSGTAPAVKRNSPLFPDGYLGNFNMSSSSYRIASRFELDAATTIDRFYFTINGEGSDPVGGRSGYGNGTGGTWRGQIVTVNQTTGLPTTTVLAEETVSAATAHSRARSEFGLSVTHQIHWVQFSPITLQPGVMYAFVLRNTDSNPGGGNSAASGNHMSVNLNWADNIADLGPNGRNELNRDASGAVSGFGPRETTMWSADGGSTWKFGDQIGWYDVETNNGLGRIWACGYRVSGGTSVPLGFPLMAWPGSMTGASITYRGTPRAVTLTHAGGASRSGNVGVITVTNLSTGVSGKTSSLGQGMPTGVLDNPVPVAVGQSYSVSCSGTVKMASPTSGHGAVYGIGSRVPWNVTSNGSSSQLPALYASPHPFFAQVSSAPAGSEVYRPVALLWPDDDNPDTDWPYGAEYDFWELGGPDEAEAQAFMHFPSLDGNDSQRQFTKAGVNSNDWHNYAIEWTPNELVGYIDGVEWFRTSGGASSVRRAIQDAPGPMHLCLQFDPTAASDLQAGKMEVDWIRVYPLTPIIDGGGGGGGGTPTPIGNYPTFTAVGSSVSGEDSSIAVPAPPGVQNGHFQICIIQCATVADINTIPADWLLLDEQAVDNADITGPPGGPSIAYIFYNTTGDSSTRSWVKSDTRAFHAVRVAWKDYSTLGQHFSRGSSFTLTPYATPVTPGTDKAVAITVLCSDRRTTSPQPVSVPTGWTSRYNNSPTVGPNAEIQTITVAEIQVDNRTPAGANVPTGTGLETSNFKLTNADNCSVFSFVLEGPVTTGTIFTGQTRLVIQAALSIDLFLGPVPAGSILLQAFPQLIALTNLRGSINLYALGNMLVGASLFPRGAFIIIPNLTFTSRQVSFAALLLQAVVGLRSGALPYRRPVLRNEYEYPPEDHPFRLIAQRILDGEIIEWELPVDEDFEYTDQLSGPTVMQGSFKPERIAVQELGLDGYAYWLHVEIGQEIRASAIMLPPQYEGSVMTFTAEGVAAVPHYFTYDSVYSQLQVDPLSVVRTLWNYVQAQPQSDYGVVVSQNSSPVRLGKLATTETTTNTDGTTTTREIPAEPYELNWWDAKNVGEEIDSLSGQTPFDYVERHKWNADRTDVLHYVDLGYPRLGTVRENLLFNEENILEVVPVQEAEDTYASAVLVIGAGDGADTIRAFRSSPFGDRVRKQVVVTDKSITSQQAANIRAEQELARRRGRMFEIGELTVNAYHSNAPIGSYQVGDDIQVQVEVSWLMIMHTAWYRITSIQNRPSSDRVRLGLARSDTLLDTSEIWIEPDDYVPFQPPPPVGSVGWNGNMYLLINTTLMAVPPVPIPTANVVLVLVPVLSANAGLYGGSFAFINMFVVPTFSTSSRLGAVGLVAIQATPVLSANGIATAPGFSTVNLVSSTVLSVGPVTFVVTSGVTLNVVASLTANAAVITTQAGSATLSASASLSTTGRLTAMGAVSLAASTGLSANGTTSSGTTVTQLGNTSDGTGSSSSSANKTVVSKATASVVGSITAGHARLWVDSGTASVKMCVYADNSGVPGNLLGLSDAITVSNTTEALKDFVFSGAQQASITNGSDYWIGFTWADPGTNNIFWSRGTTAGQAQQNSLNSAASFGTPGTTLSGPIDAYVDVTSSTGGGGGSQPEVSAVSPAMMTSASASTLTSAAFNAPANSLIVVCAHTDGAFNSHNVTNNGAALTWSTIGIQCRAPGGSTGSAAAFVAPCPSARTGLTVTWNSGAGADDIGVKVYVITDADLADPIGGKTQGASTSNTLITTAFTAEKANSLCFVVADDFEVLGTTTAPGLDAFFKYDSSGVAGGSGYKRTGAAGSSVTLSMDAAGTAASDWNWVAFEIRGA